MAVGTGSNGLLLTLMLFLVALFAALVAVETPPRHDQPDLPPALSLLAPHGAVTPTGIRLTTPFFVTDSAALTEAGVAFLPAVSAAARRLREGERLALDVVPLSADAELAATRLATLATALSAHGVSLPDVALGSARGQGNGIIHLLAREA